MSLIIDSVAAVHVICCVFALATGLPILVAKKGDKAHVGRGRMFVIAMVILNVTSLSVYRFDMFYFPHWYAILSLAVILAGFLVGAAQALQKLAARPRILHGIFVLSVTRGRRD